MCVCMYVCGLYMPNPSLAPVYMGYTYIFSAFIWLFSYIMNSEYIILASFKDVILYQVHFGPVV